MAEPKLQDYVYASMLAYLDDPAAGMRKFGALPGYKVSASHDLGDGFQAAVFEGGGDTLIAFRGTLPDVGGVVDRYMAVYGDELAAAQGGMVSGDQLRQLEADQAALGEAPLIQDLIADVAIFNGKTVAQFNDAVRLVQGYTGKAGKVYVTGHSLGGGIADAVASVNPGVTGTTFAAPGDVLFNSSGVGTGKLTNYINANDPVGMVNLAHHVGQVKVLDQVHTSYAVEAALSFPQRRLYGFNWTLDTDSALSAKTKDTVGIILGSLGFLVARLAVYHPMENYAANVGCAPLDPSKAHKPATIQDLAAMAQKCIAAVLMASTWSPAIAATPYITPVLVPFSVKLARKGERTFWEIMTAYGKAVIEAGPYGGMLLAP